MTPWNFTCILSSNDALKESVERLSNTNSLLLLLATMQRAAGNVTNGEIYNVQKSFTNILRKSFH